MGIVTHLPHINATLNAITSVLLLIGRVHIARRRIVAHRAAMLAAVGVSVLFLIGYVTYHLSAPIFVFRGHGMIRPVYYTLLVSHVLLAAAAMSMLGGFAVLGGMDFSGLELIVFCITGIAVLFLAAQKGAPAKDKRSYTLVFVLLMLSKLAAGGWAGDLCSALVWPGLLAIEYGHGRPIQRPLQLVCISEALRLLFWLLTRYAGMSALAFWTNIMFVLLACARGWAALVLYKTQEETL